MLFINHILLVSSTLYFSFFYFTSYFLLYFLFLFLFFLTVLRSLSLLCWRYSKLESKEKQKIIGKIQINKKVNENKITTSNLHFIFFHIKRYLFILLLAFSLVNRSLNTRLRNFTLVLFMTWPTSTICIHIICFILHLILFRSIFLILVIFQKHSQLEGK